MKRTAVLLMIVALMLLAACGGSSASESPASNDSSTDSAASTDSGETETMEEPEPAAEEETPTEAAAEEEPAMEEEPTEEPAAESDPEAEAEAAPTAEEEPAAEEEMAEEEGPAGFGDLPLSGTDPDTGLEINPEVVNPGDTFLVRGTVISMNLTPVTEPEFLIEAPNGKKYRMRTQPLADMFFVDGSQWQPFEYQLGVGAQGTVSLASDASLSDVATTEDLMLVMLEE